MKNLLILFLILAFGCNQKMVPKATDKPDGNPMMEIESTDQGLPIVRSKLPSYKWSKYNQNLNSIITTEPEITLVQLDDYVAADKYYKIFSEGMVVKRKSHCEIAISKMWPALSFVGYTTKDDSIEYIIPVRKSPKKSIHFTFSPQGKDYKAVQLVGDINAWNPANTPMRLEGGDWVADMNLVPGRYAYQVVLDGEWRLDPNNQVQVKMTFQCFG